MPEFGMWDIAFCITFLRCVRFSFLYAGKLKTAQSNTLSEHQRTPCFCHLILSLQMIMSVQLLSEVGEIFSAVTYDGPSFYGWEWGKSLIVAKHSSTDKP